MTEDEKALLDIVAVLDGGKGASWTELLDATRAMGMSRERLEEVTNALLDKGLVFEPVLGRLRRT